MRVSTIGKFLVLLVTLITISACGGGGDGGTSADDTNGQNIAVTDDGSSQGSDNADSTSDLEENPVITDGTGDDRRDDEAENDDSEGDDGTDGGTSDDDNTDGNDDDTASGDGTDSGTDDTGNTGGNDTPDDGDTGDDSNGDDTGDTDGTDTDDGDDIDPSGGDDTGDDDDTPLDSDSDGIPDDSDNCAQTSNANQLDTDADGTGDVCDSDLDGDGIANTADNCPSTANPAQTDADFDAIGDLCDGKVTDLIPPTLLSYSPGPGAALPLDSLITLTFSEMVNQGSLAFDLIRTHDGPGLAMPQISNIGLDPDTNTATFRVIDTLQPNTQYTLKSKGAVTDLAGNELLIELTFTTETVDALTLSSASPQDSQKNVPTNLTQATLEFSNTLDLEFLPAHEQAQLLKGNVPVATEVSITDKRISLSWAETLSPKTFYQITYTVRDTFGQMLDAKFGFTTGESVDTTPPAVTARIPDIDATNVNSHTQIIVTIDDLIDNGTVDNTSIILHDKLTEQPVDGEVALVKFATQQQSSLRFTPSSNLAPGRTYTVNVSSEVLDEGGNALSNHAPWSFTTAGTAGEFSVVDYSPKESVTSLFDPISVTFNWGGVKQSTVTSHTFTVTDESGAPVPGSFSHTNHKTTTFIPQQALQHETQYTVALSAEITDVYDNALQPTEWQFSTPTNQATMTVLGFSLQDHAENVDENQAITVYFSKKVRNYVLESRITAAGTALNYVVDGSTVTVSPQTPWPEGTTVQLVVDGVQDLNNKPQLEPRTLEFTIAPDLTPPSIMTVAPANGASSIDIASPGISVLFDRPTTVIYGGIYLKDPAADGIEQTALTNAWEAVASANNPSLWLLQPTANAAPLKHNHTYIITVNANGAIYTQDKPQALFEGVHEYSFTTQHDPSPATATIAASVIDNDPSQGLQYVFTAAFSKPIKTESINNADAVTLLVGEHSVPLNVEFASNVLTITPNERLPHNTVATLALSSAIVDHWDIPIASGQEMQLTTDKESVAPTDNLDTRLPATGATGVSTTPSISTTMSEAILASSVSAETVWLSRLTAAGEVIPAIATLESDGQTITITPSAPLQKGQTYFANIKGVLDTSLNPSPWINWNFKTVEPNKVAIQSVLPVKGSTNIALDTPMQITFSEAMDATGFQANNIRIVRATQEVSWNVSIDGKVATFTLDDPLEFGTPYTVQIIKPDNIMSLEGGALDLDPYAHALSFTTTHPTPHVIESSLYPANSSTDIPITENKIRLSFSEYMMKESLAGITITQSDTNTSIPFTVAQSAGDDGLSSTKHWHFTLGSPLLPATTYQVEVPTSVMSDKSKSLSEAFSWSFSTAADTVAPTATIEGPEHGATDVKINDGTFTITFSENMDETTVWSTDGVFIQDSAGSHITINKSYNSTSNTLTISPVNAFAFDSSYTFTLSTTLKDLGGNSVVAQTRTFTTEAAPDTTLPTVSILSPLPGANQVPVDSPIQVQFDEAVTDIQISCSVPYDGTENLLEMHSWQHGALTYDSQSNIATWHIDPPLYAHVPPTKAPYTCSVHQACDTANNCITTAIATSWSFTTYEPPTPQITDVTPSAEEPLPVNGAITVNFSEAMHPSTLESTSTVILRKLSDASPVDRTVTYHNDSKSLVIQPSTTLNYEESYQLTITTAAKSAEYAPLNEEAVFTFTTEADPSLSVSSIMPAHGSNSVFVSIIPHVALHGVVDESSITSDTLSLYRCLPEEVECSTPVGGTTSFHSDSNGLQFTPSANLHYDATYTLELNAGQISSIEGEPIATGAQSTFSTASGVGQLSTIDQHPVPNETNVPIDSTITLGIAEQWDTATNTNELVSLYDLGTKELVPALVNWNDGNATITPTHLLKHSTSYEVIFDGTLAAINGATLGANRNWTFTTTSTIPARPTATYPAPGATHPRTEPLAIYFSAQVPEALSKELMVRHLDSGEIIKGESMLIPGSQGHAMKFTPVQPWPAGEHSALLRLSNEQGWSRDFSWSFTAHATQEVTPAPTLLWTSHPEGTEVAQYTASILLEFSEHLQELSDKNIPLVELEILTNDGSGVTVPTSTRVHTSQYIVKPAQALQPDRTYRLTILGSLANLSGAAIGQNQSWTFTVSPQSTSVDSAKLFIRSIDNSNTRIVYHSTQHLIPSSFSASAVQLHRGRAIHDLLYTCQQTVCEATPHPRLDSGQEYHVRTTDNALVTTTHNTWASLPNSPITPSNNENVQTATILAHSFDTPVTTLEDLGTRTIDISSKIHPWSITADTVALQDANGHVLPSDISTTALNDDAMRIHIKPQQELDYGTHSIALLPGLQSLSGNTLTVGDSGVVDFTYQGADPNKDTDGDGNLDTKDNDIDGDGVLNYEDLCPMIADPNQYDFDGDLLGDACDDDLDGDGIPNSSDTDNDNDNIADSIDLCPGFASADNSDSDGDGIGDPCDNVDDSASSGDSGGTVGSGTVDPTPVNNVILEQVTTVAGANGGPGHSPRRLHSPHKVVAHNSDVYVVDGNVVLRGVMTSGNTLEFTKYFSSGNTPLLSITIHNDRLFVLSRDTSEKCTVRYIPTGLSSVNSLVIETWGTFNCANATPPMIAAMGKIYIMSGPETFTLLDPYTPNNVSEFAISLAVNVLPSDWPITTSPTDITYQSSDNAFYITVPQQGMLARINLSDKSFKTYDVSSSITPRSLTMIPGSQDIAILTDKISGSIHQYDFHNLTSTVIHGGGTYTDSSVGFARDIEFNEQGLLLFTDTETIRASFLGSLLTLGGKHRHSDHVAAIGPAARFHDLHHIALSPDGSQAYLVDRYCTAENVCYDLFRIASILSDGQLDVEAASILLSNGAGTTTVSDIAVNPTDGEVYVLFHELMNNNVYAGEGKLFRVDIPGKRLQAVQVPLHFLASSTSSTDDSYHVKFTAELGKAIAFGTDGTLYSARRRDFALSCTIGANDTEECTTNVVGARLQIINGLQLLDYSKHGTSAWSDEITKLSGTTVPHTYQNASPTGDFAVRKLGDSYVWSYGDNLIRNNISSGDILTSHTTMQVGSGPRLFVGDSFYITGKTNKYFSNSHPTLLLAENIWDDILENDPGEEVFTIVSGQQNVSEAKDGLGSAALWNGIDDMAYDPVHNRIFVVDNNENVVRMISE